MAEFLINFFLAAMKELIFLTTPTFEYPRVYHTTMSVTELETELVTDGDVLPLKNTSEEVSREENTVAVTEVGPGVAQIKQKYV